MKFSRVTYSVLSTIFMLSMTAIFVAGSLIFIITQVYDYVSEIRGFWVTLPTMIITIVGLFSIFMFLIKSHFFRSFDQGKSEEKSSANLTKEFFTSILVYEASKLIRYYRCKKKYQDKDDK